MSENLHSKIIIKHLNQAYELTRSFTYLDKTQYKIMINIFT